MLTMQSLLTEWDPQSQLEPLGIVVIQKNNPGHYMNDFVDALKPLFSLDSIFKEY